MVYNLTVASDEHKLIRLEGRTVLCLHNDINGLPTDTDPSFSEINFFTHGEHQIA